MAKRIQIRRDTAANWTSTNPTLAQGEPGYETDTGKLKYGDGSTEWSDLEYFSSTDIESTDELTEGETNLYYTNARVDDRISPFSDSLSGHIADNSNPHSVTKSQVGLSNVDNTSDTNKPVSTPQQASLDLKANLSSPTFTGTVSGITSSMVGLGNVNNTSDANKPVSTAQQTALDLKANIAAVIGLQDLWFGAGAMWPKTTGGCAVLAKSEIATSLVNIQSLDFDQNTQEFAQFTLSLPRNWNNGTITAKFYWTASAGSGTVQWGISGGAYSNDDALTVALGTAVTVDDTLISTNDLHVTDVSGAITLAGTPASADFLAFQISRNPASDTLSGDAKLLGVVITLTTSNGVAA